MPIFDPYHVSLLQSQNDAILAHDLLIIICISQAYHSPLIWRIRLITEVIFVIPYIFRYCPLGIYKGEK